MKVVAVIALALPFLGCTIAPEATIDLIAGGALALSLLAP